MINSNKLKIFSQQNSYGGNRETNLNLIENNDIILKESKKATKDKFLPNNNSQKEIANQNDLDIMIKDKNVIFLNLNLIDDKSSNDKNNYNFKNCSVMEKIKNKKNIFGIIYPKKFIIFNEGGYDNNTREYINNIFHKEKNYKILFFSRMKAIKKKNRKNNDDNIRKKIKTRFLKTLKNTVNYKLKLAGSKKMFTFLQQKFIINISKEMNKYILDLTFKEIFSTNFCDSGNRDDANIRKFYENLKVLDYLEKNKDISQKSTYNAFKNMKYYQIFEEYLRSKEFEIEINRLKKQFGNDDKYIKKYIKLAYCLNEYFSQ